MQLYEAFARALASHGVETMFGLMGDGNLFMADRFARLPGVRFVAAVHEANAVAMAQGYASVSGRVGVATVTHGPGLTNTVTSLVEATRARLPLLLITGDTATTRRDSAQDIPQRDFIVPTGAGFHDVRSADDALADLSHAIDRAYREHRPIVLNVPVDLWQHHVEPSQPVRVEVTRQAVNSDPDALDKAAGIIAAARRPLVLVGRGGIGDDARVAIETLADRVGALLATTVKAKGLFAGRPHDLGVFGSLADQRAAMAIEQADCIIAFGAALNPRTTMRGTLLADKAVVQVDCDPQAFARHLPVAAEVHGDAAHVADELSSMLAEAEVPPSGFRSRFVEDHAASDGAETSEPDSPPGTVGMLGALAHIDRLVPADRTLVFDTGRFVGRAISRLGVRGPRDFVDTLNFSAIGLGVGVAIGASYANDGRPVLLAVGDGGFLLGGLNELVTAVREQRDLIVVVFNDGAYGAEYVQFSRQGLDPSSTQFEWPDLAPIAAAIGAQGVTVRDEADFEAVGTALAQRRGPVLIDVKLDARKVAELP